MTTQNRQKSNAKKTKNKNKKTNNNKTHLYYFYIYIIYVFIILLLMYRSLKFKQSLCLVLSIVLIRLLWQWCTCIILLFSLMMWRFILGKPLIHGFICTGIVYKVLYVSEIGLQLVIFHFFLVVLVCYQNPTIVSTKSKIQKSNYDMEDITVTS